MRYRVDITARALQEIDEQLAWLANRSAPGAARWHEKLCAAVESLEDDPMRCPLAPENDWHLGNELRQLCIGKRRGLYRILFEIRGRVVYILRVRHGSQDLLDPEDI
jgi:plasmid stabilization system protein ParE